MLFDILIWISHALPFYRASQDAGFDSFDAQAFSTYLEAVLITKGP